MKLKPCPCGETPEELHVSDEAGCKHAFVTGSCCGEWIVEFRTINYNPHSSDSMQAAIKSWNETKRG